MAELVMDSSEEVFELDKKVLTFQINSNSLKDLESIAKNLPKVISETEVFVKNLTSEYLAFRTKITKKQYYTVNPTYATIEPNSTLKIEIGYYVSPGEQVDSNGHKFRFDGFIIPSNKKDENPKNVFSEYSSNGQKVRGCLKKLQVKFLENNEYSLNNISKSAVQNIKHRLDENILSESVYSIANPKEKVTGSVFRSGGKKLSSPESEKEMYESLKSENLRLKEQLDNLNANCSGLKSRIEAEKKDSGLSRGGSNKFHYNVKEIPVKKVSMNFIMIAAAFSLVLGFFLAK